MWQKMVDCGHRKAQKVVLLSLVAGTRTVALPEDFTKVRLLEHLVGSVWYPCDFYERYDTAVTNQNTADVGNQYRFAYSILENNIVLEPTPANDETDTLRLTYFYQVDDLEADDEEPEIEKIFQYTLISGCCVQAKEKEEMIGGGGADTIPFLRTYNEQMQQFVNNIQLQTQQRIYTQPYGPY